MENNPNLAAIQVGVPHDSTGSARSERRTHHEVMRQAKGWKEPLAFPEVSGESLDKWQRLVDLMAEIVTVPAGLIMRIAGEEIEVAVSSTAVGNPYHAGHRVRLPDSGLYCETVIKNCAELHIPNALALQRWCKNPDVKLNMVSYLGYPLRWPDQSVFGTICVLDCKENVYSEKYKHVIQSFRDVVENDLRRDYTHWKTSCTEAYTRFDRLLSGLPQLVYECRLISQSQRLFTYVNARGSLEFGLALKAKDAGDQLPAMLHPQDKERVLAAWACKSESRGYNLQYRLLFSDGSVRWVSDRAESEEGRDENLLSGVLTDISSLKAEEESLANAEILSAAGSWRWKSGEGHLTFSHGLCELLRLVSDNCRCPLDRLEAMFSDGSGAKLNRAIQQCAEDGNPYELELRTRSASGQTHFFRALGKVLADEQGRQQGQHGSIQDVTRERNQQRWTEAQNEKMQLAMIVGAIAHWEVTLPNAAFIPGILMSRLYASSAPAQERTHARHWLRLVHPEDRRALVEQMRSALNGVSFVNHQHRVVLNGETKTVRTSAQAFHDSTFTPIRLIGTVVDVTREQEIAASLQAAEKLAAVGRLASAVSHEINNPLQAVSNLLYTARQAAQGGEIDTLLQTAEEELGRATRQVSHSLRLHRQSTLTEEVSFGELVDTALSSFKPQLIRLKVQLQVRVTSDVRLHCYRTDLEHALVSLVSNAVGALSAVDHPQLSVRVRNVFRAGKSCGVSILVADNGPGIASNIRERLFEPFVTTKGERATGLGLWVAKGILDRHSASIRLRTRQGKSLPGTVFRIVIPDSATKRLLTLHP